MVWCGVVWLVGLEMFCRLFALFGLMRLVGGGGGFLVKIVVPFGSGVGGVVAVSGGVRLCWC